LPVSIIFINKLQNLENQLLVKGGRSGADTVSMVHQMEKKKSHGDLIDAPLIWLVI
jgi:hypothetical protein